MIGPSSPLTMLLSRHTRRREFITLLGGAAVRGRSRRAAQQAAMPVIGLMSGRAPNEASRPVAEAFRSGLAQIGYVEARNVVIEYYWMEGQTERFPIIATELARRTVSVIVAVGTVSAQAGRALVSFHRPQSSSASRRTASHAGFFISSQSGERPER